MADVPERPESSAGPSREEVDNEVLEADAETRGDDGTDGSDAAGADMDDLEVSERVLEAELETLAAERDRYLDHLKRVQADYENHRKLTHKRVEERVARELGDVIEKLLPVLDACDAAAAQGESDAVEPIVTQLYGVLNKEGLERIDPKGDSFDPEVAEAVAHEPGEGGEQVVAEVMRPGYRWKGRLLRPALVKVTD